MDSKKTLRRFQKQTSFLVYDHTSMLLNLMVDVLGITPVTQGYHQSSWDWWWARWIFWSVPLYHPYLNDVFSQRVPSGKDRKHCGKSPYYGMLWVNPLFLCAIFNSKLLVYQKVPGFWYTDIGCTFRRTAAWSNWSRWVIGQTLPAHLVALRS